MRVCFTTLFLIPILALGQGHEYVAKPATKIEYYLNLYSQASGTSTATDKVLNFTEKLDHKKLSFKQSKDFLEFIFNKTHQRFLKHYTDYASFGEMLGQSKYNCLTATALYALMLDHFDVGYQIIETNYHIFLLAHTDQGTILFETTDPANGFVSDPVEIEKRISKYRENSIRKAKSTKIYYRYNFDLYNEVNLDQMLGLLHYNLSIVSYNKKDLPASIHQLTKALELYQSPRIEEFSRIIMLTVLESDLEASVKEKCLKDIQSIRKKQLDATASAN